MTAVNLTLAAQLLQQRNVLYLGIKNISQPSTLTCWATIYAMVDRWANGTKKSFCEYVALQRGSCAGQKCRRPSGQCNLPRKPIHFLADWQVLGFVNTQHHNHAYSVWEIEQCLRANVPVQIYYVHKGNGSAHTCLIVGLTQVPGFSGVRIVFNDPNKSIGIQETDPVALHNWGHWQQSWAIRA